MKGSFTTGIEPRPQYVKKKPVRRNHETLAGDKNLEQLLDRHYEALTEEGKKKIDPYYKAMKNMDPEDRLAITNHCFSIYIKTTKMSMAGALEVFYKIMIYITNLEEVYKKKQQN